MKKIYRNVIIPTIQHRYVTWTFTTFIPFNTVINVLLRFPWMTTEKDYFGFVIDITVSHIDLLLDRLFLMLTV